MAGNLGGRRLHGGDRSDEVCRRTDVEKLVKAETLAEATHPQFTTGDYGFGFQIGRPDEVRTYGHGGGAPGMNAILRVYPESGQSVIVLCNLDSPSASRLGDWLHARLPVKD